MSGMKDGDAQAAPPWLASAAPKREKVKLPKRQKPEGYVEPDDLRHHVPELF